jgi:hypothetical protein
MGIPTKRLEVPPEMLVTELLEVVVVPVKEAEVAMKTSLIFAPLTERTPAPLPFAWSTMKLHSIRTGFTRVE